MSNTNGLNNVEKIIDRFGGMRAMARKADVPVSTIQGWKKRDHIPSERVDEILQAAKAHNISLGVSANENTNPVQPQTPPQTAETAPTQTQSQPLSAQPAPQAQSYNAQSPVKPRTTENVMPRRDYPSIDPRQLRRDTTRRSAITTVSIIAVLGVTGWFLFGNEVKQVTTLAQDQKQIDARVNAISNQYTSFESTVTDGLNSLSSRITDVAAAVGVERNTSGEIVLKDNMSLSQRLTALESRLRAGGEEIDLGQLMTRFDSMQQTAEGQQNMNVALSDLKAIVTMLQGRIGQLDIALEQAKQDNDELAQALENVSGRDLGAAAMLLALTQFRESMNREQPFSEDLEVLQQLVGNDDPALTASINRLAPHAQSGVLTPEGLSQELRTISGDIIVAKLNGEDVSVKDKILGRLGQILSIEKDGKPLVAIEEQKIIAEAQEALDRGDVQSAVAALNRLDGDAAAAAAPFKAKAQGTLAAETTTEMLMEKFFEKLKQPNGVQNMINDVTGGGVKQDQASGIIILE